MNKLDIRKIKIDNRFKNVITPEAMKSNLDVYCNTGYALDRGDGYIYPIRNSIDSNFGFYSNGLVGFYKNPNDEINLSQYEKSNVLDFNEAKNIKDMTDKINELKDMEREILTNPDNIFVPPIKDSNNPEAKAFKQAVIDKGIDINKYENRMGASFTNDIRLFKKDSITLDKMKHIAEALDIKITMIFEDANPDVPNPMNTKISTQITGIGGDSDGEE